jgi:hypothetical protein
MAKQSFFQKVFGDRRAEKAAEKRLARVEKQQQMILRLLLRKEFAGLINPVFDATGIAAHSMQGEDGHILHILREIGATNQHFVEIGIQNGLECNTANLTFNFGWSGVLIEGNPSDAAVAQRNYACFPRVTVRQSFVTRENVVELLKSAGAKNDADLFSLDIDGNDYWVWEALTDFKPRVAVVEYNAAYGPTRSVTIPYSPTFCVSSDPSRLYCGASLAALTKLANKKGYALVGTADNGPNAFYVRRDCLKGALSETTPEQSYRPVHLKRYSPQEAEKVNKLPLQEV